MTSGGRSFCRRQLWLLKRGRIGESCNFVNLCDFFVAVSTYAFIQRQTVCVWAIGRRTWWQRIGHVVLCWPWLVPWTLPVRCSSTADWFQFTSARLASMTGPRTWTHASTMPSMWRGIDRWAILLAWWHGCYTD